MAAPHSVIARLDRAIQYPLAGGYWIARSSRAMTSIVDASVLIEAEGVDIHLPVTIGPGGSVSRELGVGLGADFPLIDHADLGANRHLDLHWHAIRRHAGVPASVRKRQTFGPLRPQAGLLRECV